MRCPDDKQLTQYLRGALPVSELISVSEHVCSCGDCRSRVAVLSAYRKAALSVGQTVLAISECPEYEELSAFVDETLSHETHQSTERHISSCELCWRDVETLQAARSRASLAPEITVHQGQFANERARVWLGWRKLAGLAAAAAIVVGAIVAMPKHSASPTGGSAVVAQNHNAQDQTLPSHDTAKPSLPGVTNSVKPNAKTVALLPSDVSTKTRPTHFDHSKPVVSTPEPEQIALNDGGNMAVSESGGKLSVNLDDAAIAALVEKKLQNGKVQPSFKVAMNTDVLRGPVDEAKVSKISPAPNGIADTRPEFKWNPVDGVTKYRVEVYDLDGTPVLSAETDRTSYRPDSRLAGGCYKWVVRTRRAELAQWKWSKAEVFRVLSESERNMISKAQKQYPGSHLVLGTVYEHLGLHTDAVKEFQALSQENPNSKLAGRLLEGAKNSQP